MQPTLEALPDPRTVRVGFTVFDDLGGGWTQRTLNDAARFRAHQALERSGWVNLPLWTSEPPDQESLRPLVLEAASRTAWGCRHGDPRTLGQMMRQEGEVAAAAERTVHLDPTDLEYSRTVLAPLLERDEAPITFAAMYGDRCARELGYPPLGLSEQAGFQVGLADALEARR